MNIQVYESGDKLGNDQNENTKEHLLQFPKPFSILIIGPSNVGKSNLVKNIINQNDFKIIYLMHADLDSHDYDDVPHIKYEIGNDYIDRFREYSEYPKLLIIDDIDFRNMKKETANWFYKMLTYTRTHTNLSIISTVQDCIYYTPLIRRTFPIVVIYKYIDLIPLKHSQVYNAIPKKQLDYALKNLTQTDYDFVLVNNKTKRSWICINNKIKLLSDYSGKEYYID